MPGVNVHIVARWATSYIASEHPVHSHVVADDAAAQARMIKLLSCKIDDGASQVMPNWSSVFSRVKQKVMEASKERRRKGPRDNVIDSVKRYTHAQRWLWMCCVTCAQTLVKSSPFMDDLHCCQSPSNYCTPILSQTLRDPSIFESGRRRSGRN